jgi:catechol 2,3-dioxygenase-like lactoylglutathione lyase family enzyme
MIHHVNFQVPRALAEECATFYELLGFRRAMPPLALTDRSLWLSRAGTQIHLEFASREGEEVAVAGDSGPGHIAIVVPSFAETLVALREAGVTIEPRGKHWNSPRCFVRDPAGNRLELMESEP